MIFHFAFLNKMVPAKAGRPVGSKNSLTARVANNDSLIHVVWSQSVVLNDTKMISLRNIPKNGLGQLHLSYVDTVNHHGIAAGALFRVLLEASATRSSTWNQNAPTKTPVSTSTSPMQTSILASDASQWDAQQYMPHPPMSGHGRPPWAAAATFYSTLVASTAPAFPTCRSPYSVGNHQSKLSGAVIASIVLGSIIITILLILPKC